MGKLISTTSLVENTANQDLDLFEINGKMI